MTLSAMHALPAAAIDRPEPTQAARLSTDYLNRYGEALMLLEMAASDPEILCELGGWCPVGYREHFAQSPLRCAASALRAFDALEPARRAGFEELCAAMNRLVATATALLAEAPEQLDPACLVEVAGTALRRLIGRATQFINANGALDLGTIEDRRLQDEIDALMAS